MGLQLNARQQQAAEAGVACAVVASAGTGKTGTLTQRYLAELRAGRSPLQIVAITYTDKAAGELRERIRRELEAWQGAESPALAELDIAPIGTIHSLCARICQEHPAAADVAPGFSILADADGPLFRQQHLDDILVSLGAGAFDPVELPFGLARTAVGSLLEQPHLAAEALAILDHPWDEVREVWEDRLARRREAILAGLCGADWDQRVAYLRRLRPNDPSDKLAVALRIALDAVASMEAGGDRLDALRAIAGCGKGGIGTAKAWAPLVPKDDVRDPLYALRGACADAVAAYDACVLTDADEALWRRAQRLKAIYDVVAAELWQRMQLAGALDFAGLETGALRALGEGSVRDWYRARWAVLLVDETQDVNRTQSELIEALIGCFDDPSVCLVGDAKQSIYGFRGAAVEEFERLSAWLQEDARLRGRKVELEQTYRQHTGLAASFNELFRTVLGGLSADVVSEGQPPHEAAPYLELAIVQDPAPADDGAAVVADLTQRRWVEANWVADRIREFVETGLPVSTRDGTRPAGYGDVAVLAKVWASLDPVQEALAARGIPAVHGGGGNLLDTREAKDGLVLLRFLAQPHDSLALAAVLRSPWFAVSDRALQELARAAGPRPWWLVLRDGGRLERETGVLRTLAERSRALAAHELLREADRLTGFTAVLANLPLGDRRLSDWRAFEALVTDLADSGPQVFQVYRRLQELLHLAIDVPRPVVEARGAVSLLTIHASKGLEFPLVFVPDLGRQRRSLDATVLFDRELGVAVRPPAEEDRKQTYLWRELFDKTMQRGIEEERRLLYVACTRAGDRLVLSAAAARDEDSGGSREISLLDLLRPGYEAAGWAIDGIPFDPAAALPPELPPQPLRTRPDKAAVCLADLGPCLDDLPVSALDTYRRCPREFRYQQIDRNRGVAEGRGTRAQDIGTLVHDAIEHALPDEAALQAAMPHLEADRIREAWELVTAWQESPKFAGVRGDGDDVEVPVTLTIGGLDLHGRIDRLGPDYVVDYKTGAAVDAAEHELQVWAYARATGREQGYIADLRTPELVSLDAGRLAVLDGVAEEVVAGIRRGDFTPNDGPERCGTCAYRQCEHHRRPLPDEA